MRVLLLGMLLVFLIAGPVNAQGQGPNDSARVEKLFDDYLRDYLRLYPEEASQLGLPKTSGYEFDRGGLDDGSDAGIEAGFELARKYLIELQRIDVKALDRSQVVDVIYLTWLLRLQLEGKRFLDDRLGIDHLGGVQGALINLMTTYHEVADLQDARDYLRRLDKFPVRIEQAKQQVIRQEANGLRPPVYIIDRVLADLTSLTNAGLADNPIYDDFKTKLSRVANIDSATAAQMLEQAAEILQHRTNPAFKDFAAVCESSRTKADSVMGVWRLPNGGEYYQYSLKSFTSASQTPQQVFDLGVKEVARLQKQGRVLLDSLGIRGDSTFGALMVAYWETWNAPERKDKFFYPDVPNRNDLILQDYRDLVDGAWKRLPEVFAYIPKAPVAVLPVPEYRQASGLTYYESASLDGSRKATFYINMASPLAKPGMRTLTYHETIPGHHFQIATQQELTQQRLFKNLYFLSGFGEGWAMYCEDLAAELGWLPDIESRMAEINSQLFRAVRIVTDAGIHYKRWTRQQALDYMKDNLGWGSINEIDRYTVWPGQACAYTIGRIKIQELREKARRELGPAFDLKQFHLSVLQNGSIPLDMLEEVVDDYIARSK